MKAPTFTTLATSTQMAEISALLAAQLADDTPDCKCGEECCTLEEAGLEETAELAWILADEEMRHAAE
mgnify:FL=1